MNKCNKVRETCKWVVEQGKYIKIHQDKFVSLPQFKFKVFGDFKHHLSHKQSDEKRLSFIFFLDACNFCFWPKEDYEYDNLCEDIKKIVLENKIIPGKILSLQTLVDMNILNQLPLQYQRLVNIWEVIEFVTQYFNGSFIQLVEAANKSAIKLLQIITKMTGFQDHTIYKGRQVHFYKRSQILIADIYGCFNGEGLGQFKDINELTMFADYRVPQIFTHLGILEYDEFLSKKIQNMQQIIPGSQQQVEIRAFTVVTVQKLKEFYRKKGVIVNSYQVDWFLWQLGQGLRKQINKHHRTLTIYY